MKKEEQILCSAKIFTRISKKTKKKEKKKRITNGAKNGEWTTECAVHHGWMKNGCIFSKPPVSRLETTVQSTRMLQIGKLFYEEFSIALLKIQSSCRLTTPVTPLDFAAFIPSHIVIVRFYIWRVDDCRNAPRASLGAALLGSEEEAAALRTVPTAAKSIESTAEVINILRIPTGRQVHVNSQSFPSPRIASKTTTSAL